MKTITWGMIGCGDVTEVKNGPGLYLAKNSRLKGITNRTKSKAVAWSERHQQGMVYESVDELLQDEEIDIVYIAVTPDKHRDYAIQCAKAGKHCLIEKPLAMTYEEGMAIQEAFQVAGKKAYVAFYRRRLNRFLKIKEILQEGRLGKNLQYQIQRYVNPIEDKEAWRAKPDVSGGNVFTETDIHILDFMDELFGEVEEFKFQKACNEKEDNGFDQLVMAVRYKNGVLGTGNWNYQSKFERDQVQIVGEKGILSFDFFHNNQPLVLETDDGVEQIVIEDSKHVGLLMEQAIVDELCGQGEFSGTIEAALRTLKITDRIWNA